VRVITVGTFAKLHDVLEEHRNQNGWVFRGQTEESWALTPKIWRLGFNTDQERRLFNEWKLRAVEFIPGRNPINEWDWIAIAQHHKLNTRLLDWTRNPLAAVFFAVHKWKETDAALFAYHPPREASYTTYSALDYNAGIGAYRPATIAPRIGRQAGLFTVHPPHISDMLGDKESLDKLVKIIIKREYRKELKTQLAALGMNAVTLFPDLDSLSQHMNDLADGWKERDSKRGGTR
jgi:FRG domain